MNRMTTRMLALGAAAVALGLSGCAASGAAGDSSGDAGSKGAVAMSFAGLDIQIWVDQLEYMEPEIEAAGYELLSDDPQWNIQNQVSSWESWIQRGDVKAIADSFNRDLGDSPELKSNLMDKRNANWAGWVKGRLDQPGTVLVAVGAGHLAGDGSVLSLLENRA